MSSLATIPAITNVDHGRITISGLPLYAGAPQDSNLAEIVLRLKKLWAEGDRLSRDGFQERRRARFPFEVLPMSCRLDTSYTILQDSNGDVKLDLLVNCAHPGYWVDERGRYDCPMDEAAISTAFQFFVDMVCSELTQHFFVVFQETPRGSTPDYWDAAPPLLPFPYESPRYRRHYTALFPRSPQEKAV